MDYQKLKNKYKSLIKKNMKQLDTYKEEYDMLIEVFAGILSEYDLITEKLINNNFDIETETQRGTSRKSALQTANEKLRSDILMFSDRLMLNPKTVISAKIKGSTTESILAKTLRLMDAETNG